jgi:hypothetical protein
VEPHPLLLDRTHPYAPLGSDEGAAVEQRYVRWRADGRPPAAFFAEQARVWELPAAAADWPAHEVQERFAADDSDGLLWDFAAMAVPYCQWVHEGGVCEPDRERGIRALTRQSLLCVPEMGWSEPADRAAVLELAVACLRGAPTLAGPDGAPDTGRESG